jgi:hypothetical protein
MSYAKDFFKQNPVVSVIGAGVVGLIAYRVIKNVLFKEKIPVLPVIPPVPDQPTEPEQKKYSYIAQQYADFAQTLFDAMTGSIWGGNAGTDETAIQRVMQKMNTKADVLALITAYGRRKLTTPYGWSTDPMTLKQSFDYELEPDELEMYVNAPIRKTGYKF